MSELINYIVKYASQNRMPAYLVGNDRYRDSERVSQKQLEKIRQLLSEEGQQRLKDLLSELELMQDEALEAMCLAGISIGLELSRL